MPKFYPSLLLLHLLKKDDPTLRLRLKHLGDPEPQEHFQKWTIQRKEQSWDSDIKNLQMFLFCSFWGADKKFRVDRENTRPWWECTNVRLVYMVHHLWCITSGASSLVHHLWFITSGASTAGDAPLVHQPLVHHLWCITSGASPLMHQPLVMHLWCIDLLWFL